MKTYARFVLYGFISGVIGASAAVCADAYNRYKLTPEVTTPSTFTPSTSDLRAFDEYVMAMCEAQAMEVTLSLVKMSPELFTEEGVIEIMGYLYNNCLRDNGRSA